MRDNQDQAEEFEDALWKLIERRRHCGLSKRDALATLEMTTVTLNDEEEE